MQTAKTTSSNSLCRPKKGRSVLRCMSNLLAPTSLKLTCWRFSLRGQADFWEHRKRAEANPLRAAGLSQANRACTTLGSNHACGSRVFNLFFLQFQTGLRSTLKQADLVTEIPFGEEKIFLSSPGSRTTALNGPTFVDDVVVLLCGDNPSQLIDKIQEATRIYVEHGQEIRSDDQFQ